MQLSLLNVITALLRSFHVDVFPRPKSFVHLSLPFLFAGVFSLIFSRTKIESTLLADDNRSRIRRWWRSSPSKNPVKEPGRRDAAVERRPPSGRRPSSPRGSLRLIPIAGTVTAIFSLARSCPHHSVDRSSSKTR